MGGDYMNILNIMNFLNFLNNMNYDVEAEKSHLPAIIFVECFVSIHMTVFVLKPLSKMISKDNSKIVLYILSGIRAAILIYCDIIGYYEIAIIDFFIIFLLKLCFIFSFGYRQLKYIYSYIYPPPSTSYLLHQR